MDTHERTSASQPSEAVSAILSGIQFPEAKEDERPNTLGYLERLVNTRVDPRLTLAAVRVRFLNTHSGHFSYFALDARDDMTKQQAKIALLRPEIVLDEGGNRASDGVILQRIREAIQARRNETENPYLVDMQRDGQKILDYQEALGKKGVGTSLDGYGPFVLEHLYSASPTDTGDFADTASYDVYKSGSDPRQGIWKEGGAIRHIRDNADPMKEFSIVGFAKQGIADMQQVNSAVTPAVSAAPVA